jgi:hypothetical protein
MIRSRFRFHVAIRIDVARIVLAIAALLATLHQ